MRMPTWVCGWHPQKFNQSAADNSQGFQTSGMQIMRPVTCQQADETTTCPTKQNHPCQNLQIAGEVVVNFVCSAPIKEKQMRLVKGVLLLVLVEVLVFVRLVFWGSFRLHAATDVQTLHVLESPIASDDLRLLGGAMCAARCTGLSLTCGWCKVLR
jgi:hypothetical protein